MTGNDADTPKLRAVLTSRERQTLINEREAAWIRGLQGMSIDVGHHPFLSAGDSEIVEARFYERLRLGTPFEQNLSDEDLAAACAAIAATTEAVDRSVVVFSPNAEVLGAF